MHKFSRGSFVSCRDANASSPDCERALCLSEPASLGKEGKGLCRRRGSTRFQRTPQRPVPHPSGLSASVAPLLPALRPEALSQSGEGAFAVSSSANFLGTNGGMGSKE